MKTIKIGYRKYLADKNINIFTIKRKDGNKLGLRKQFKNLQTLIYTGKTQFIPVMGGNMANSSTAGEGIIKWQE